MTSNYFTKNGVSLEPLSPKKVVEASFFRIYDKKIENCVTTLIEPRNSIETKLKTQKIHNNSLKIKLNTFFKKYDLFIEKVQTKALDFLPRKIPANTISVWFGVTSALFIFTAIPVLSKRNVVTTDVGDRYSIYSSKPLTMTPSRQNIGTKDSRAQKINEVFSYYKCPLEGMGEKFVDEAEKNGIPWWLVAAVSFQESSCGKKTPKTNDGGESYNAWGWGVYGNNLKTFDNWAKGVDTVSKYFNENFYSKGETDLCVIMKTYTPPSDGSWCRGVEYFGDIIRNYQTPVTD